MRIVIIALQGALAGVSSSTLILLFGIFSEVLTNRLAHILIGCNHTHKMVHYLL
jgi:hypothetical protein